jgi:hypothetical protein
MRAKQARDLPGRRNICIVGPSATLSAGSMVPAKI